MDDWRHSITGPDQAGADNYAGGRGLVGASGDATSRKTTVALVLSLKSSLNSAAKLLFLNKVMDKAKVDGLCRHKIIGKECKWHSIC